MRVGRASTASCKAKWVNHGAYHEGFLPNGMRVRIAPTKAAGPLVRVQNVYGFGSNAEASNAERGLAHVIEHMIFKGTTSDQTFEAKALPYAYRGDSRMISRAAVEAAVRTRYPDRLDAMVELAAVGALHLSECDVDTIGRFYGASMNAFTSLDKTSYYFEVGRGAWAPFLCVFAASMKSSRLDEQHLRSELHAVLNELAMGNDNYPREAIGKLLERVYDVGEDGHYNTIGSERDLLRLDAPRLRAFYETHYRPWHATLYVVGDVDVEATKRMCARLFGTHDVAAYRSLQGPPPPCARPPPVPAPSASRTLLYHDVPQPTLLYAFRIGASDTHARYLVPKAVAHALSGTAHAPLVERLVHADPPLAHSVECFAEQYQRSGVFFVVVEPVVGPAETGSDQAARRRARGRLRAAQDEIDAALRGVLAAPLVGVDSTTLTHMQIEWRDSQRSLDALTNGWVDLVGCGAPADAAFAPPTAELLEGADRMRAACLRLDRAHVAVVTPSSMCEGYAEAALARRAARLHLTEELLATKTRTAPLEPQSFGKLLPDLPPLDADDFVVSGVVSTAPLALVDASHGQQRCVVVLAGSDALAGTLQGALLAVAAKAAYREPAVRAVLRSMEASGDRVAVGATSASLVRDGVARDAARRDGSLAALLALMDASPGVVGFEAAQHAVASALRAQAASTLHAATHTASQRAFFGDDGWTLEEGAKAVDAATAEGCRSLRQLWWGGDRVRQATMNVRRRGAGRAFEAAKGRVASGGAVDVHLPMESVQTALVLARPGRYASDASFGGLPTSALIPLLHAICYQSLGSRLYAVRERTGLFYSCSGGFGIDSGTDGAGMDRIVVRCKPEAAAATLAAVEGFARSLRTGSPPLSEQELTSAKALVTKGLVGSIRPDGAAATLVGFALRSGRCDENVVRDHVASVLGVSLSTLRSFAKDAFRRPFSIRVSAGPTDPFAA